MNRRFEISLILCALVCWSITLLIWAFLPTIERSPETLSQLTNCGRVNYWPEYDMPVYVVMCVISLIATGLTGYLVFLKDKPTAGEAVKVNPFRFTYIDLGFTIFLFLVIWIPNADHLTEQSYHIDDFHHLDFYIMSPLHMYNHGAALGTDSFIQYQSGWVLLFAMLSKFTDVDHAFVIQVFSLFGCVYYIAWYLFLRMLNFNSIWAIFSILACLISHHFVVFQSSMNCTMWTFPQATICRNPTDVFVLSSLYYLYASNRLRYAFSAGCFVGLGLLFGNDTGVYVTFATLGACVLRFIEDKQKRGQALIQCSTIVLCAVVVALSGLAIVSRGTILQKEFWTGFYEALLLYSSGFSSTPINGNFRLEVVYLILNILFLSMLVIYTVNIARSTILTYIGKATLYEPLYAFIGIVGFGTLIVFINRSHVYKLTHVVMPAIVLLVAEFLRITNRKGPYVPAEPSRISNRLGILLCVASLAVMFVRPNFKEHTSLLNLWTGNFSGELPTRKYQEALQLLPQLKTEIEQRLGNEPYALVGDDATLWLMVFDKQSPSRYLPMTVFLRVQQDTMLKELDQPNLIYCRLTNFYNRDDVPPMLERKYTLIDSTQYYDIYRRSDLPPLQLQPAKPLQTEPSKVQGD